MKIRFICVRFNCKRKMWGEKMDGNYVHQGGGGPTHEGKIHFKFPFCFSPQQCIIQYLKGKAIA